MSTHTGEQNRRRCSGYTENAEGAYFDGQRIFISQATVLKSRHSMIVRKGPKLTRSKKTQRLEKNKRHRASHETVVFPTQLISTKPWRPSLRWVESEPPAIVGECVSRFVARFKSELTNAMTLEPEAARNHVPALTFQTHDGFRNGLSVQQKM